MKVKIFSKVISPKLNFLSKPVEEIDCGLESEINNWLSQHPTAEVKNIKQSQSGGSWAPAKLLISVWYE